MFTPKSLLRADAAKSAAADFVDHAFRPVLADPEPPEAPTRIVFCTGKVAYDLLDARRSSGANAAVIRLEQLYPFPADELRALLATMPTLREAVWGQEEPANMGAWSFVAPLLRDLLGPLPLTYAGRLASPSPATGSSRLHQAEQEKLAADAVR